MDLTQTTLIELRDAIASKTISAMQATQAYLDRIEQLNPAIHAFHELYAQRALERAKQVDDGKITGPLAGVPIAIKDNLCTPFGHTTCSSRMLENFKAPYMATAIGKLEDAGAIILGKTVMDEFAMGSSTEHSAVGAAKNPWDTNCVPGGSSGGSAASVAADLAAGAMGSDTGGSIRQPAAFCGVVGLKPTYGRVSRYGLIAFASSLDQIGPFAHTVSDAALLLQIISGHDPLDSTSIDKPVPDYLAETDKPIKNLKVGIAKQYHSDANDPAVTQAIDRAIDAFKAQGAQIVDVDLPHTEYGIPTYYIVATAEASSNLARYDGIHYGHRAKEADDLIDLYAASRAEGFGDEVKRRIMLGNYVLSSGYYDAYYLRAMKVRRLIANDFTQAFKQCDTILCPTTTGAAFSFGDKSDDPLKMYLNDIYTVNANLAGIPGISIPFGLTDDTKPRPIGVQLYCPAFEDARLLRIAKMLENAGQYTTQRPHASTMV